jgi:CHAD domain-containing protein
MSRKQLKHIIRNHFNKLKKYSRKIPGDFDLETMHQFRVEYKKLRAFFRLLSQAREINKEIKISKKLKKIYTLAGLLRSYQLQLQWVKSATQNSLKKPFEYYYLLHGKMEKLKPKLLASFSAKPLKVSKKKAFLSLPQECTLPRYSDYAEDSLNNVRAIILADLFFDDYIHTIRKILKDLSYNGKIYARAGEDQFILQVKGVTDEQYLDQLLDELGRFQDKSAAIELMRADWLKKIDGAQRQQLETIRSLWVEEKAAMKQMLVTKFRSGLVLVHFAAIQQSEETGADYNHNGS